MHLILMPAATGLALWFMLNVFFILQAMELWSRHAKSTPVTSTWELIR